jgi:hypothetical protein
MDVQTVIFTQKRPLWQPCAEVLHLRTRLIIFVRASPRLTLQSPPLVRWLTPITLAHTADMANCDGGRGWGRSAFGLYTELTTGTTIGLLRASLIPATLLQCTSCCCGDTTALNLGSQGSWKLLFSPYRGTTLMKVAFDVMAPPSD